MGELAGPLAANVRRRREEIGLSLSALARTSGVSKSTLSEIERGMGNPAIDTLWALAQALGVPFAALIDDNGGRPPVRVVRFDDAPIMHSGEPGFITRHLFNRYEGAKFEVYVIDIETGGTRRDARGHGTGVIEHSVVFSGQVEIGPEGESVLVGVGDCISFPADRAHHYEAVGGPARILSIHEYPTPAPG